ncbi:hypothetical protein [Paenibacillus larvae]|nr:hypothetical protein [Paenibacillus larvae]MCY7522330.1 hypothetical protein [Paenibacillus larvae]MCY9502792.1 hypothetical protein [Paenibacillus larvae]MCY9678228.1 hypothetical protein [Paenibacillus larvae]MCY9750784.1 hypothetical protein [Paenibacillus larvae]MCY9774258.1 hypothetical protein [Paenibacillus larvae]
MELVAADVMENGKRVPVQVDSFVTLEMAHLSTKELMNRTTYELLQLLAMVRTENEDLADAVRIAKTAYDMDASFHDLVKTVIEKQEFWMKKVFVLENILRDRLGYIPKSLNDQVLEQVKNLITMGNLTSMRIKNESVVAF